MLPPGPDSIQLVVSALPGRSVELKTGSTFAAEVAAEVSEHKHHDCKSAKMRLSTAFNRVTRCFRQRGVWRVDMCVRTCFRV